MIHKYVEIDDEHNVEIPCETFILADESGRALVKKVELTDSVFLGATESFGCFEVGKSSNPRWRPTQICLDGNCIVVLFENGAFYGIPLDKVRFFSYQTHTKRNLQALNLAKARAAKARKAEEQDEE